jgi:cytochrome d ubiquinol oxidase subunit I
MLSMTPVAPDRLVPLQILFGDMHGLNTLHHQPAKLAAIEAHWEHEARAPLALFAIPDPEAEKNHFVIEVPLLGSLILTHDVNGVVPGLKDFPAEDRAPAHHSLLCLSHQGGRGPGSCWRWCWSGCG